MATLMAPNLSLSAAGPSDDNMEISSDAGRQHDDYLDIDIDLGDHPGTINADDYMLEDGALMETNSVSEVNQFPDDDMMDKIDDEDGFMSFGHETHDEDLQDATLYDEDDTEVVDNQEYPEDNIEEDTNVAISEPEHNARVQSIDNFDDLGVPASYDAPDLNEQLHAGVIEETQLTDEPKRTSPGHPIDELVEDQSEISDDNSGNARALGIDDVLLGDTSAARVEALPSAGSDLKEASLQVPIAGAEGEETAAQYSVDVTIEKVESAALHRNSSHDLHASLDPRAHPVIIVYDGQEINLFPATDGNEPTQFFLSDRAMLDANLLDFLASCRIVLRDHVTENEALEIDVAELGMILNEDSNQASLFSLADVLDVYVQLCHNDGIHSPDPLYVSLVTKPRFASRMTDLSTAVRDGKGFSAVFPIDNVEVYSSESEEYEHAEAAVEQHHSPVVEGHAVFDNADADGKTYDEVVIGESKQVSEDFRNHAEDYNLNIEDVAQPVPVGDDDRDLVSKTFSNGEKDEFNAVPFEELHADGLNQEFVDADTHNTSTGMIAENEGKTEEDFEDDLLDYSDEEEEENNGRAAEVHSSSSSTVQGETSAAVEFADSVNDNPVERGIKVQEDYEISNFDTELYENGEAEFDYTAGGDQYFEGDQEEYQDDIENYVEFDTKNDQCELGDGSFSDLGKPANSSSNSAPTAVEGKGEDGKQLPPLSGGQHSPPPTTPSLKRSRVYEEDELEDSDSENDAKKARSS